MKMILLMLAVMLMSGCAPREAGAKGAPRWEYKTVEVEPYESDSEEMSSASARVAQTHGYPSRWEGQNIITLSEHELNRYGAEGWELVSAVTEIETTYPKRANTRTSKIILLFKREK